MTRYAVLLRGVNVGGHNKVPMAKFRGLLESLGHTEVASYVQSGNAVFTSPPGGTKPSVSTMTEQIESALAEQVGVDVRALVLTRNRLVQVRDHNPLIDLDDDPTHQVVAFLSGIPKPEAVKAIQVDPGPEQLRILKDVIYVHYPDGQGRSKLDLAKAFRGLGVWATARNWRTVNKLIELAET